MKKECPFRGCKERIWTHVFCCRRHWLLMSRKHRDEVQNANLDRLNGAASPGEMMRRWQRVIDAEEEVCSES